jgi:hypothetical protein
VIPATCASTSTRRSPMDATAILPRPTKRLLGACCVALPAVHRGCLPPALACVACAGIAPPRHAIAVERAASWHKSASLCAWPDRWSSPHSPGCSPDLLAGVWHASMSSPRLAPPFLSVASHRSLLHGEFQFYRNQQPLAHRQEFGTVGRSRGLNKRDALGCASRAAARGKQAGSRGENDVCL